MPFATDEKRALPANRKSQSLNIGSVPASAILRLTEDDLPQQLGAAISIRLPFSPRHQPNDIV